LLFEYDLFRLKESNNHEILINSIKKLEENFNYFKIWVKKTVYLLKKSYLFVERKFFKDIGTTK